ncbi:MAG: GTPase HflX [Acholeplasmatales bacterium]|nr:GTPase HflX [Acholeplasmatales bacterium]
MEEIYDAIIVSIDYDDGLIDYYEKELANLCEANDINRVYKIRQKLDKPKVGYFVGMGKLDEIKMVATTYDINLVIFNDELSPSQIRNIENCLDLEVIDRSMLILNIFASRAKTSEAMIEVSLAQYKYMLPRLIGLSKSLSRQGGGFNAKGPGETQLELDRRKIEKRINKLEADLKQINISRQNRIKKRSDKTVALVGYTNSGKSKIMNALIDLYQDNKKKVLSKDMLFATLTTSNRKITFPDNQSFILTDTVGFVSKLPHHLVNSFKSTLQEITEADLILHIVDCANPNYKLQIDVTNKVLEELGCKDIPILYVYNKCDLLDEQFFPEEENSIMISAKTGFNLKLLAMTIKKMILNEVTTLELFIPYDRGDLVSKLKENENIIRMEYLDNSINVLATIKNKNLHIYEAYKKSLD